MGLDKQKEEEQKRQEEINRKEQEEKDNEPVYFKTQKEKEYDKWEKERWYKPVD